MSNPSELSVCLCASFIADPIEDFFIYWNKEFNLSVSLQIGPYNQVFQQLLDANSLLNQNKGLNILLLRAEDWIRDIGNEAAEKQIAFLDETAVSLMEAIKHSRGLNPVPMLVGIVPPSGNIKVGAGNLAHIEMLNKKLEYFLKDKPSVNLIDLNEIAKLYAVSELFDTQADEVGHIPFTEEYYAALGTYLWRKVRAYKAPSYKVIALDCDNTLWKGVCGEEGALNVSINSNFSYLQDFILKKYHEGFLIVLCSKNNENDVWEVFDKHPDMKLKREHIVAHRINWDVKPANLGSLAKELNLGLDSFIFLDDSNFEIEQISLSCPEVLSLALPEEDDNFFSFLNHVWEFDRFGVTNEDLQRNLMYKAEKLRKEEQVNYTYFEDFLQGLNIEVHLLDLSDKELDRAVQLTLRTNQFNLNGIKKTGEEIKAVISDDSSFTKIIHVKDRFGDYGLVGLILASKGDHTFQIDTFLLSCRVLGRNIEGIVLSKLRDYCQRDGLAEMIMHFKPTQKNMPFADFLIREQWIKDIHSNTYRMPVTQGQLLSSINEA